MPFKKIPQDSHVTVLICEDIRHVVAIQIFLQIKNLWFLQLLLLESWLQIFHIWAAILSKYFCFLTSLLKYGTYKGHFIPGVA